MGLILLQRRQWHIRPRRFCVLQWSVSLCRRCLHRGHSGPLFARSGRRMCFPFAAAVALSMLSPRTFRSKCDLVASLPRVALFFPLARTRSSFPGVFQLTVERGTERCVRSKASHSMGVWTPLRPVGGSAGGTRGGDMEADVAHGCQQNSQCLPSSRRKVHHAAPALTQADTRTPGRVAMWRTRACTRRRFADFETLVLLIFRKVQCDQSVEV